jgi:adenosine deaminase
MNLWFPKIELHLHLDGSIRFELAMRLAGERGINVGRNTLDDFKATMQVSEDRDFYDFLKSFDVPTKILQDKESLSTIAYDLAESLAAENFDYAEIRFAPQLHCQKKLSQRDAVEAVIDGLAKAKSRFPHLDTGLILCAMMLGMPQYENRRANFETFELAKEYLGKGVAGVDAAGGEKEIENFLRYKDLFHYAASNNIPFTIHTGEVLGPENISIALDWGARRIGHGCRAIEDSFVVKRLVESKTVLEVCVSSNILCRVQPSYREHSIRPLFDQGVKVTVNSDNRTCGNTTLDKEYELLHQYLGFTGDELKLMAKNAVEAAFLPMEKKQVLLDRFSEA